MVTSILDYFYFIFAKTQYYRLGHSKEKIFILAYGSDWNSRVHIMWGPSSWQSPEVAQGIQWPETWNMGIYLYTLLLLCPSFLIKPPDFSHGDFIPTSLSDHAHLPKDSLLNIIVGLNFHPHNTSQWGLNFKMVIGREESFNL